MKKYFITIALAFCASMISQASLSEPKGELTAVLSENFDALTAGSESQPASAEISAGGKVDAALTGGVEWRGRGLHEAGGAIAVMHFEQRDWFGTEEVQGFIQTPYTDVRMDNGNFVARFRARALDADETKLYVELYDPYVTNNIASGTIDITDEWQTVEISLCHPGYGNHLAYLQIASFGEDWLMDDFEIVQDYYELMPPVVHFPRGVTYEQFTARWNAVPLTDSYLVNVFSLDDAGSRVMLAEDLPAEECTLTVSGTSKGTDYYYTVRSVNSKYTSAESAPCRVYVPLDALDRPETLEAENVTTDGFTARWSPVFRAMGYVVGLKRTFTAPEDIEATIIGEDFDAIKDGDMSWPAPFYGSLDDFTSMPGWTYNYFTVRVVKGMFGLENTYKKYGEEVFLATPALDLTADSGRFKVEVDVYGDKGDVVSVTSGDKTLTHTLVSQGEQSFALEFDNGAASTTVRFEFDGDGSSQMLFFDRIAVTQQIHAGESVTENVANIRTETADTSYEFTDLNASEGDTYYYTVTAWSYSLDEDGVWGPDVFSEVSDPQPVVIGEGAGIDDAATSETVISVSGNEVTVVADAPGMAELYTVTGVRIAGLRVAAGVNKFAVNHKGIVLLRFAGKTHRLIVR